MSDLPKGWTETTIGELATVNPKHPADADRSQFVSFVPMPAVDDLSGTISDKSDARRLADIWTGYTHFADGDVIFAKITPCMENGKIAVAEGLENGLACGSTEFHVFRSEGAIEPKYLWRFLRQRSFRERAERSMTGAVGQRRVPKKFLEDTDVPLPPFAEQKRVVAKLDALSAKSARAHTELARIETLVSRYKQAVLSKAFNGELTNSQLAQPRVMLRVGDVVSELLQGWSPKCEKLPASSDDQWAVITTTSIQPFLFDPNENKRLPSDLSPRPKLEIRKGDILITRAGPRVRCGVCCYVENSRPNLMLCDKVYKLKLDEKFDHKFFVYLMNSPNCLEAIESMKTGGNDSGLNLTQERFRDLSIPYWTTSVQYECIQIIETAFARIDRLAAEAKRALTLVGKLDEAILAKAFRGELLPQDENDEPASVLLERIRAERAAAPKPKRGRARA